MENTGIAKNLYEIADLLEIKGEDVFRIRSYRNAALVVEGLSESLRGLYQRNGEEGLTGIPGIGASTRAKIVEMLTTGRCAFHDGLLEEIPAGLLDIVKVSGVGPKKAALLYRELGIDSLDALEKAAKEEKIRELPGMGEKTEQKILKSITEFRARSAKFKLSVARRYAEAVMAHLRIVPGIVEMVPAGSLRRWKEEVGDIDILVTCAEAAPVMERFVSFHEVREVIAKGETRSSVRLSNGLQADVRTLDKASFGAALQYFTGSKAHNVALRDRARRMGLKISEYGVFTEDGRRVAGKTEEEVYRSVGLPYIEPELREGRGEIEAAEEGRLPRLLKLKDIRGDLHMHTKESDGGYTLQAMAEAAMKRGYEYIAITDHSRAVGIAHGLDEARALAQMEEIEAFNARLRKEGTRFTVLKGTEVDIRADGSLDHTDEVLSRMDCVVASVHSRFGMEKDEMTERIIKAIRSGKVHILGHPTGRLIGERAAYQVDMERVVDEAVRHDVALELNSFPDRLDLNDIHLRLALEKGAMIAISTDAHSIHHLENMAYGVHTARRAWVEKGNALNARGLKELQKILKR